MKTVIILLIKGYQRFISPFLPATCRYYPTCSSYFVQALEKYGAIIGCRLGIARILRCNPFHEGGYDPVPDFLPKWDLPRELRKIRMPRTPRASRVQHMPSGSVPYGSATMK